MTRVQSARFLTGVSSLGFVGIAALHSTGYDSITRVSRDLPAPMGDVMPVLWLVFSSDLVVLGLIVGALALRPTDMARPILAIAAICPLVAAGLQLWSIGFVPPTALLIALGVLTLVSAANWPPRRGATAQGRSQGDA